MIEQSVIAFVAAAALLTITPGLDTALVLRAATAEGRRSAFLAGLGVCLGCIAWGVIVAVGLGALLAASKGAYAVLKIAGAAYLLYLGVTLILRSGRSTPDVGDIGVEVGRFAWFRRGLFTNLLNPKVGAFYTAFLPQFVPQGVNVTAFTLLLALIHAVLGFIWFVVLAQLTVPARRYLQSGRVSVWLDRALGGLLLLVGARLLASVRE